MGYVLRRLIVVLIMGSKKFVRLLRCVLVRDIFF